jgi:MFS family permease
MKKLSLTIFITALVITLALIAVEQYYIAVALVSGTIIMLHRELWSLLRRRKLPPVDERVKQNTAKAVRNGFIYFAAATVLLMMPFTEILTENPDTVHVLAGLFLSAGLVYMLSYIFYDIAEPKMTGKLLKLLKTFLLIIGLAVGAFIIGVFLHNALGKILSFEEPVFFIIAVVISPLALAVGLIGSLVLFIVGLAKKTP